VPPPRTPPPRVENSSENPEAYLYWQLYRLAKQFGKSVFTAQEILARYHAVSPGWPNTVEELTPYLNALTGPKYDVLQVVGTPGQWGGKVRGYMFVPSQRVGTRRDAAPNPRGGDGHRDGLRARPGRGEPSDGHGS
jgi:hypothetical protein